MVRVIPSTLEDADTIKAYLVTQYSPSQLEKGAVWYIADFANDFDLFRIYRLKYESLKYNEERIERATGNIVGLYVRKSASERFDSPFQFLNSRPLAHRLSRNKISPSKSTCRDQLLYLAGFTRPAASPDSHGKTPSSHSRMKSPE